MNEKIRDSELRVIGSDGAQLGIMSREQALDLAESQNLDLVKIASNVTPAVCKVMDYGKYKFEQSKKEKEARKNQKVVCIKEVRVTPNIDNHDFNTKLNQAKRFLEEGDKVKISIRFRGREIAYAKLGEKVINDFIDKLSEIGNSEARPKLEGRSMFAIVSPGVK